MLYSSGRSVLELDLLSCIDSLIMLLSRPEIESLISSFSNSWCLNEITLIPSSKWFLLLLEFPRKFIFMGCLPHASQSCYLLYIHDFHLTLCFLAHCKWYWNSLPTSIIFFPPESKLEVKSKLSNLSRPWKFSFYVRYKHLLQ